MLQIVVSDSACLIGLAKIGQEGILPALFSKIYLPVAVWEELFVQGEGKPGSERLKHAHWLEKKSVTNKLAVQTLQLTLGWGESEAIVLTEEMAADFLILDDWKARQTALALGFPVVGTLALLLKAEQEKQIDDAQEIVNQLRNVGFRLPNVTRKKS